MKLIKLAAGVVNTTPLDWKGNLANILTCIDEARNQDVTLLCLPELCLSGYGCEDMFYAPYVAETALSMLDEIVPYTSDLAVSVGMPLMLNNKVYNASCFIVNRQIRGFALKKNLANNGIHYETRWFHAWASGERTNVKINGIDYPVGDLLFEVAGVKIGFEICEDAWIANRPGRELYARGVDIILNPSASHFSFFKSQTRERFVQDGSRSFGCVYVYTNLLGNEAGRAIYDGDAMIAQSGEMLASGTRFSYTDHYMVTATVDLEKGRLEQTQNRAVFSKAGDALTVSVPFQWPDIRPARNQYLLEDWEAKGYQKEEEFARAVSLALFDYLRKSRSQGFVVSLSGGADSSACAALVYLMVELGIESIGLDKFKERLGYITKIQDATTTKEIVHELLYCIWQGTENSSKETKHSATSLAEDINARFFDVNINGLVETYKGLIEEGLERKLSWDTDDIALQNIQARVRAPSAWLLTNVYNCLLLSTSNRSEASVGYATMDGDTAGSISPLAGIDKTYLRKWLLWLEKVGLGGTLRVPGLNAMNNLQPTAELRPADRKQTDEADLMPYEVLNAIETYGFRDKQAPKEVLKKLELDFEGVYTREELAGWTERFFRLWSRNQWKRERYAPSFHIDDRNLDPRTWLRFPILSGGFEKELAELREEANAPAGRRRIGFGN
ncbi:NAD(+) synthase [Siphonobacter sp. SORGH_AS_0500]|uniref:NAD(+) synthase n=1 Tax=Siphonobacter sp. SORGH_AS_0500 TaxID=1864824 RepID=UPI000CB2DF48|nr:NAD(+) synthase [Siphonobacter sp. SORGH_AS_0500]PKK35644.1 NAD(+) synthase [Siphonobacter sp. SORGH_AS_0500]